MCDGSVERKTFGCHDKAKNNLSKRCDRQPLWTDTFVVVHVVFHIQRTNCQPEKLLYPVVNPARGLLNGRKANKIERLAAHLPFHAAINLSLRRRRFPIGPLFLLSTPSSPHCTLKVSKHDSLWQPPAAYSDERPRPYTTKNIRRF